MKKQALMKSHFELVKKGKFDTAWLVLEFLRKKSICLGLDDASWEASLIIDDIGFCSWTSSRTGLITFKM